MDRRTAPMMTMTLAVAALLVSPVALHGGTATVDHSSWTRILQATVDDAGWVDYRAIGQQHQAALDEYIARLGRVDVEQLKNDNEKKAFWLNAYNAVTIRILIDKGLPETVPHARFFGKNIFTQEDYRVAGKVRSLDEIEHEILRKQFDDPRIHAALVCGASSCPRLRSDAYTGEALETQLTEEAEHWVQRGRNKDGRRKNRLDKSEGVYYVSEIFKWFNEDFHGGGKKGVLTFLKTFGDKDNRMYLETNSVDIEYLDYDWSLNSRRDT